MNNNLLTYFMYAIGEIILVVVGILIAVQIDDFYKEQERIQVERENYRLILADLRKDSATFSKYHAIYSKYLDLYFEANRIYSGKESSKTDLFFDYLVMNIGFDPITQENHKNTIEKMLDREVREQLNNYFVGLGPIKLTTQEFNRLIQDESRPFFFSKYNVFKNEAVFNEQNRTFPPFLGVSTFNEDNVIRAMKDEGFLPILSALRMSVGAYLAFLERSIEQNNTLIKTLESKLN